MYCATCMSSRQAHVLYIIYIPEKTKNKTKQNETNNKKQKTENKKLQKKSIYGIELCKFVITHSNFPLYIDFFS